MGEHTPGFLPVVDRVEGIPVLWISPMTPREHAPLVIWLPGLTATKEDLLSYLQDLAAAGSIALSFDPWQHGERGTETRHELANRVFGNFRRHMWPILGQTALDVTRVLDWATETWGAQRPLHAGGISMGGDIAIAAAGLDPRITSVAAMIATPDWLRPGMHKDGTLLHPGAPDTYARFFYDHLNPLTHLSSYAHRPAIAMECGAEDTHVPPDGALRFQAALQQMDTAYADRLQVTLHPGVGHTATPGMWHNCRAWLARPHREMPAPGDGQVARGPSPGAGAAE